MSENSGKRVFPANNNRPRIKLDQGWVSLDELDNGVVSKIAALEQRVRDLNTTNDTFLTEIAWRLRLCQCAYYQARSFSVLAHYQGHKLSRGAIQPAIHKVKFHKNDPASHLESNTTYGPMLILNCESFYHGAFRIVDLTRKENCILPRIAPMSIIKICNKILKHTEPGPGKFSMGGTAFTPIMNAGEVLDDGFKDLGMASNCKELIDCLNDALDQIQQASAPTQLVGD